MQLVDTLQTSKVTATEISEQLKSSEQTKIKLDSAIEVRCMDEVMNWILSCFEPSVVEDCSEHLSLHKMHPKLWCYIESNFRVLKCYIYCPICNCAILLQDNHWQNSRGLRQHRHQQPHLLANTDLSRNLQMADSCRLPGAPHCYIRLSSLLYKVHCAACSHDRGVRNICMIGRTFYLLFSADVYLKHWPAGFTVL